MGQGTCEWLVWAHDQERSYPTISPHELIVDGITKAMFWICSYRPIFGSIAIQRYHRMGLLDSGRLTVNGIARAAFWWDRVRANSLYGSWLGAYPCNDITG